MAAIQIHIQLPNTPLTDDTLDPLDNWTWVHILTFPVDRLAALRLSKRPYKWIRYATGVVAGAKGDLCRERDVASSLVNYDSLDLSNAPGDLYYRIPDATDRIRLFPLDPALGRKRASMGSVSSLSSSQVAFREQVMNRDGRRCVFTGYEESLCDAIHLIAYDRGDEYIANLTHRRARQWHDASSSGPILIDRINDIRNGLFVNASAHRTLGTSMAILATPNFALDTDDIYTVDTESRADKGQMRYTAHLLDASVPNAFGGPQVRSGHAIRTPENVDYWPPDVLFEVVYASAVVHQFGVSSTLEEIKSQWGDVFCSRATASAQANRVQKHAVIASRPELEATETAYRHRREDRTRDMDAIDMVALLPFINFTPEQVKRVVKAHQEKTALSERQALESRVRSWRDTVDASTED